MKNSDSPMHPAPYTHDVYLGLTKREYFAAMAMQGICVNAGRNGHNFNNTGELVREAVNIADNLLKALEEPNTPTP